MLYDAFSCILRVRRRVFEHMFPSHALLILSFADSLGGSVTFGKRQECEGMMNGKGLKPFMARGSGAA